MSEFDWAGRKRRVCEIHVWRDRLAEIQQDDGEGDPPRCYSVSEIDANGEEIRCLGGYSSILRASRAGLDRAKDLGVPLREYADAAEGGMGPLTDSWDPPETDETEGGAS